ncbi:MAG: hypothetical protein HUU38_14935 [Anaerolineales bacterium]|nr:hypothetical protein [Anaerolineales bacterium]
MTNPLGDVSLTARIAGLTYDLNSEAIRLLDYDLGLATATRLSQRTPGQQGDTDLGFRLAPRFLNLYWIMAAATNTDYRANRKTMLEVFQPRDNDAVVLTFDFGGGLLRNVDVNLDGPLLFSQRVEWIEHCSGVFKAADPRLYHPDIKTVLFNLAGTGSATQGWEIPWEIPWEIGTDTLNATANILYAPTLEGDSGSRLGAVEYPVIRIFGPVENPVITNETTGDVIALTDEGGLVLADETEWVEIDLADPPRRDAKTILDQDGNSAAHYLTPESDFFSWHLAPAGERLPAGNYGDGVNVIRVVGANVTAVTRVVMNYYDRYVGV